VMVNKYNYEDWKFELTVLCTKIELSETTRDALTYWNLCRLVLILCCESVEGCQYRLDDVDHGISWLWTFGVKAKRDCTIHIDHLLNSVKPKHTWISCRRYYRVSSNCHQEMVLQVWNSDKDSGTLRSLSNCRSGKETWHHLLSDCRCLPEPSKVLLTKKYSEVKVVRLRSRFMDFFVFPSSKRK
jgi:hypothetical protein